MRRPGLTGDVWPDEIQELLLQAVHLPGAPGLAAWQTVRPHIDVDHLPGELHRLMPLLSKALTDRGVNDPDLARLKGVYQFSWYRNTTLFADAAVLLQELIAADIKTVVLRGAAVGLGHRHDVGARPMNDMDVLVHREGLAEARRVAVGAGWRPLVMRQPLERRWAAAPLRNSHGRVIRLHWLPSPHLALPDAPWDDLWDRAVHLRVRGVDTLMLSVADHLIHTCVDGVRANSGASLRWITDAMALVSSPTAKVDWDLVLAEAERLRVTLLISEALRYLQQALDAEVPTPILAALARTPTTPRDGASHRLSLTTTRRAPSAAEILGRFTRFTAGTSVLRAGAAAPQFLAAVLEVESPRQVPAAAVKRIARAALSPEPPLATLSTAGHTTSVHPSSANVRP